MSVDLVVLCDAATMTKRHVLVRLAWAPDLDDDPAIRDRGIMQFAAETEAEAVLEARAWAAAHDGQRTPENRETNRQVIERWLFDRTEWVHLDQV